MYMCHGDGCSDASTVWWMQASVARFVYQHVSIAVIVREAVVVLIINNLVRTLLLELKRWHKQTYKPIF